MMSSDSTPLSSNNSNQSEVITFPTEPTEVVSKEEIGKWVDLLLEMPEPGNSGSDFINKGLEQFDNPFCCVAEKILSEENLR